MSFDLACSGGAGRRGAATIDDDEHTDAEVVATWNSKARRGAVIERLHGVEVADPYRSLELDTPETRAWIEAQTARSERRLAPQVTAEMRGRITELMSIGVLTNPDLGGDRVFFLLRDANQEQAVLMTRGLDSAGTARALLDPNDLGERVAVDWYYPSPTGRLVAVGLSRDGDERSVLHLLDVATGAELDDRIAHCKWSGLSWLPDETGFYYTRYPRAGEAGYDADEPDTYFPRVFFHRLGADPAGDLLVYGADNPQDFPSPDVSDDGRYLVINVMRGWSRSDVYLLDRVSAEAVLRPVSEGCDCLISGAVRQGRLWLLTNEDHPRYRVLAVAPAAAGDRAMWREVIPESDASIEQLGVAADRLVVHETRDFASRVRCTTLEGFPTSELTLPANGSIDGIVVRHDANHAVLVFSSFFHPPTLLAMDVTTGEAAVLERVETDVDVSRYQVTQASVVSADGTPVNVFLAHRRGAVPDGAHRVLLYGYGGFNISILPSFSRRALYWLEQGGVYAVANLRGGGELGEAWHRAGQLENKHHVFEDFEAVVRWLGQTWSAPERIAITGGSNGGLLVGAALVRCPDAFAAAAAYVGLYDMLRYHRFPPAELWVSEYGSADDAAQFEYLRAYSPYHNIRDGIGYPAALIETADHDTRVFWGHSTKFAARLQDAAVDPSAVLFYMDRSVGHGAGTGRSDLVEQTIRLHAFLTWRLGTGEPEAVADAPVGGGDDDHQDR